MFKATGALVKQQGPPSESLDGEKTANEHKETRPTKRTNRDHTNLRTPFCIFFKSALSSSWARLLLFLFRFQVCICNSEIPPSFPLKLAFNLCFCHLLERERVWERDSKGNNKICLFLSVLPFNMTLYYEVILLLMLIMFHYLAGSVARNGARLGLAS